VGWFGRTVAPESAEAPGAPEPARPPPPAELDWEEGAAPGLAALFEGVEVGRGRSVLDLGPATPEAFRLYRPLARTIRFLGGAGGPGGDGDPSRLLEDARGPCDLILLWDALDRLPPEARAAFVGAVARLAAPGARMHLVTRGSAEAPRTPLRFVPVAADRLRHAVVPGEPLGHPLLLPAEVNRVLEPFRVRRGFVLRGGLREYLATLPGDLDPA
jgi:hypothetical protein